MIRTRNDKIVVEIAKEVVQTDFLHSYINDTEHGFFFNLIRTIQRALVLSTVCQSSWRAPPCPPLDGSKRRNFVVNISDNLGLSDNGTLVVISRLYVMGMYWLVRNGIGFNDFAHGFYLLPDSASAAESHNSKNLLNRFFLRLLQGLSP
ncbi:hypothetical protein IF1G_08956 [Cordyceps javanica]|uniref:Uncharacterized protein n=1 Tax=Cordyceps javanica TaxID=43265 RepID=A0A545USI5_9HYPO|nr:hypothetical protein IF1G_08956 [Cordyceps javanica]